MVTKKCLVCGKEFATYPSHVKRRKFCSRKCKALTLKGKPFFDSTGIPSWNKGTHGLMKSWNKGKHGIYSPETIEKLRQAGLNRPPEKHSCWKGGRRNMKGYISIFSPDHTFKDKNNCVREHRLIMEKFLGRYLNDEEVVHHKNGDRMDNRLENLKLFSNNCAHIKCHVSLGDIKGRPPKVRLSL